MAGYNVAVVGATGMVGQMMLRVLEEKNFPVNTCFPYASARSAGKSLEFKGEKRTVLELKEGCFDHMGIDIALFSAGGGPSELYAPMAAKAGAVVIDNSSCWRMNPEVPLVVPEVNPQEIKNAKKGIIANPNCSTIQAVVALKPLYDKYGIKRIVYATYQAVSGGGSAAYNDLKNGIGGQAPKKFQHPIFANVFPHIDVFMADGYTKEERKMMNETRKIIGDESLAITATCVRVPVYTGHSEAINVELKSAYDLDEVKNLLADSPGITIQDDFMNDEYPMPIYAEGKDDVFVGRIRRDDSIENGLNLWVVSDNLRKGAATNAVQIAEAYIAGK
jgi:aspartate-semialdehyde dehydrogenase